MRSAKVLTLVTALVVLSVGCGNSSNKTTATTTIPSKHLSVVVTTTQLADFVNVLGSSHVTVYDILKPGDDPHSHTLSANDINALGTADVIIKNGAGLETWFDQAMTSIVHSGALVDASVGVAMRKTSDPKSPMGDPHIWMSPVNAKFMIANIRQALTTADPGDSDSFSSAERAYDAQLDAVSNTASQSLGALTNKNLAVDHDAFGYFCDEFNLTCAQTVTPVSDSQPSSNASTTTTTVPSTTTTSTTIPGQNTLAVFASYGTPPGQATALAQSLGVKVVGGTNILYADSLGPPGSDADSYVKMIQHDVNSIVVNLH